MSRYTKNFSSSELQPNIHELTFPKSTLHFFRKLFIESGGREFKGREVIRAYAVIIQIASKISESGGRAFLVGGSVRDQIMGLPSKDFDLEVYGLDPSRLFSLLNEIAANSKQVNKIDNVGASFGVIKLFIKGGMELDISLPRLDSRPPEGQITRHNLPTIAPDISPKDGTKRRDFTLNSLLADPLTGEIIDFYGGIEDIKNKVLRVVSAETFVDDPLRVMRAIQFVARFEMSIDPKSREIIESTVGNLLILSKERLKEEWKKLLLKPNTPSLGLEEGMKLGIFAKLHPMFVELPNTPQDPQFHPEGDVWTHTKMCVDAAAEMSRKRKLEEEKSLVLLYSMLCHDLGKPLTTKILSDEKNGGSSRITSYKHEKEGVKPSSTFLVSIGLSTEIINKVLKLVEYHMAPVLLYKDKDRLSAKAIRALASNLHPATIEELVLVCEADYRGRGKTRESIDLFQGDEFLVASWLVSRAQELEVLNQKPKNTTSGNDWLTRGCTPGPKIGTLILLSNQLRDDLNLTREQILEIVDSSQGQDLEEVLREALTKQ